MKASQDLIFLISVLMFRGLDYRTTEEQIHRRLRDLTKVPIKDVRLITDKYTNKSRGFCFVEVTSVAVSSVNTDTLDIQ